MAGYGTAEGTLARLHPPPLLPGHHHPVADATSTSVHVDSIMGAARPRVEDGGHPSDRADTVTCDHCGHRYSGETYVRCPECDGHPTLAKAVPARRRALIQLARTQPAALAKSASPTATCPDPACAATYSATTYLVCPADHPASDEYLVPLAKAFRFGGFAPAPVPTLPRQTPDPRLHSHPFEENPKRPAECKVCRMGSGVHGRMKPPPPPVPPEPEEIIPEPGTVVENEDGSRSITYGPPATRTQRATVVEHADGSKTITYPPMKKASWWDRLRGRDTQPSSEPLTDSPVVKADVAKRFTLAPAYVPNRRDAHGEFATPEELQAAVWDYVRKTGGDRTVYLQHSPKPAGEWVEVVTWPYEVTADLILPGSVTKSRVTLPAGTPYLGVIWEPWAFEAVQKGWLTGFSMGGRARRTEAILTKAHGEPYPYVVEDEEAADSYQAMGILNPLAPAVAARLPYDALVAAEALSSPFLKFNASQPRDASGKWTRGGGGAAAGSPPRASGKGIGVSDRFTVSAPTPEAKHAKAWATRERPAIDAKAAFVAGKFRADNGLPEPNYGGDLNDIPASLGRARQIAAQAQLALERSKGQIDTETRAAYDDLVVQTQRQLKAMTDAGIRVEYLTRQEIIDRGLDPEGSNPYPTARAQRDQVAATGVLMIASKGGSPDYAPHPILDSSVGGAYDQFRAVHDYFGHVAAGTGFDRHGEYQAWLHHTSMFTGEARRAASSELTVENSYLAATGVSAPHFRHLLPDTMTNPFDADGNLLPDFTRRGDAIGDVAGA